MSQQSGSTTTNATTSSPTPEEQPITAGFATGTIYRDPQELKEHPKADVVPPMREQEFADLLADMQATGFRPEFPLTITEAGLVLDGRNRRNAAIKAGITSVPCQVIRVDDEIEYMLRAAILRRQLTDDQRAVLVRDFKQRLSAALKRHRAQKGAAASHDRLSAGATDKQPAQGAGSKKAPAGKADARKEAAKLGRVSENKLRQLEEIAKKVPNLIEDIRKGLSTIATARRAAKAKEEEALRRQRIAGARALGDVEGWKLGDPAKVLAEVPRQSVRVLLLRETNPNDLEDVLKDTEQAMLPDCHAFAFTSWRDEPAVRQALQTRDYAVRGRVIWDQGAIRLPPGDGPVGRELSVVWATRGTARLTRDGDVHVPAVFRSEGDAEEALERLVALLMRCATVPGECVLDPFGGRGEVAVVAKQTDRRAVAITADEAAYAVGRERLDGILGRDGAARVAAPGPANPPTPEPTK